jgi:uncharacterized protein YegJ (DUF2314 family)
MGLFDKVRNLFRGRRDRQRTVHAYAWLLTEPRRMDDETLRAIVERAVGIPLPQHPEPDETFRLGVVGAPPSFLVRLPEHMLLVNVFPRGYFDNPGSLLSQLPDLRMRQSIVEHQAWASVDLFGEYEGEPLEQGLRIIRKIAAEMSGPDCLALVETAEGKLFPYAPELVDRLRAGEPPEAVLAPVVGIPEDDPAMRAAAGEARRRWPEFLAAWHNPAPGQTGFSVKLPISDGQDHEFIWVDVKQIEHGEILGDLANEPVNLRMMRLGDRVRGRIDDVNDWCYLQDGEPVGGFTIRVLYDRLSR